MTSSGSGYDVSSRSELFAEMSCDRTRSRDAVGATALLFPILLLLRFAILGHRDQLVATVADRADALRANPTWPS